MNNIATQRIKREFKEVIKSEEVTIVFYLSIVLFLPEKYVYTIYYL